MKGDLTKKIFSHFSQIRESSSASFEGRRGGGNTLPRRLWKG